MPPTTIMGSRHIGQLNICQLSNCVSSLSLLSPCTTSILRCCVRSAHRRTGSGTGIDGTAAGSMNYSEDKDYPIRRNKGLFFHQRRVREPLTIDFPSVTYKKKVVPEVFPSIEERLAELNPVLRDPELHKKVDIGLGLVATETSRDKRKRQIGILYGLRHDKQLHKLATAKKLVVDEHEIQKDWATDGGPEHVRILAEHAGIFEHMFGSYAYFRPVVPMTVHYDYSDDEITPVFRGNIIKPREASTAPSVSWQCPPDSLWTLELSNPDGDLYKHDSECLHWLVTNIKGSDLSSGDQVVPYLPPVPPSGVGYQRMVFVLYRQTEPLTDHDQYRLEDAGDLRLRSFSTEEFYRRHQSVLTPAGLCWYNTDWDSSLSHHYHNTLGMKEPIYKYQFPEPYVAQPKEFPHRKNFVGYLDMHRDYKDISKEMLLKRLKNLDPYSLETPRLPFPHAQPIDSTGPTWKRQEIERERLGWGKYRELYKTDYKVDTLDNEKLLKEAATIEIEKNHTKRLGKNYVKIFVGIRGRRQLQEKQDKLTAIKAEQEQKTVAADK